MTQIELLETQLCVFDYAALDSETRIVVQQKTEEIRTLMRRTAQDIIDIGQKLIEVKARLGHGKFGEWLGAEFDWSQDTASNFVNVALRFGNNPKISEFAPSALYLLAKPSTPEEAREEALQLAETGQPITHSAAKSIVESHKQPSRLPSDRYERNDEDRQEFEEVEETFVEYQEDELKPENPVTVSYQPVKEIPISEQPDYDGNEWYTPAEIIELARSFYGGSIDLDPASCEEAQQTVKAKAFFTKEDDGLDQVWFGKVWMNPPYSFPEVQDFVQYATYQYEDKTCDEVLILVNNCTDAAWFRNLAKTYPVVFTYGRISFWKPGNVKFGTRQGQALFYLGKRIEAFYEAFSSVAYAPNRGM